MTLDPLTLTASIGGGAALVSTVGLSALARFYRRCGADEALVRTGSGGNRVVIGGGILAFPVLHQLLRVSLRSVKLSVERSGTNALVTDDKIKANVTTELYLKVEPIAEDVLAAARSFGERNLDEKAIADLIEGKLTDALRSVAANQTFMSLHGKRKEFAELIQQTLSEELKKNGLTLENVSITSLSMLPVEQLDANDVFDAEGLRAITESVQGNREMTNQTLRQKENAIHAQNVTARMRELELEQTQKQAEADQARKVREYAAIQDAETAKAVYVQDQARELAAYDLKRNVEQARIAQEREVAVSMSQKERAEAEARIEAEKIRMAAEIAKQREIEAAEIEKQKTIEAAEVDRQKAVQVAATEKEKVVGAALINKEQAIEVARIEKVVAVTKSEEAAARAAAARELARADEESAKQSILTVEATAKADRERQIAAIEAAAKAEVERALAEGEAKKARELAEATVARARGAAMALEAEAEADANMKRVAAQAEADSRRVIAEAQAISAEKEADAIRVLAEANARKLSAEAEGARAMVEAQNAISHERLLERIAMKGLEVAPDVVRELMAPAQKIGEIKILHTNSVGLGGAASGESGGESAPMGMITPVLRSIMQAGAVYPLVRELMSFGKVDGKELSDDARKLLGNLGSEVKKALAENASESVFAQVLVDGNANGAAPADAE